MRTQKKTSRSRRWWSRTRGLDRLVYDAYVTSVGADADRPQKLARPRILAWAGTDVGVCIAGVGVLSVGVLSIAGVGVLSIAGDDSSWTHVGWHEIEHGGWNVENQTLNWTLYGGRRGRVVLTRPGRLPEVFRERVAASIVAKRFVPVVGTRGVTVAGRRQLGLSDQPISWHSTLGRGLTWQTDGAREAADTAAAQLSVEYDPGGDA